MRLRDVTKKSYLKIQQVAATSRNFSVTLVTSCNFFRGIEFPLNLLVAQPLRLWQRLEDGK